MLVAPRRDVDGAAGIPTRQTGETPVPPPSLIDDRREDNPGDVRG